MSRRISSETAAVLTFFRESPIEHYGLEILRACALRSGSLYPILIRLENRGVLTSRLAGESDPATPGRPRRYYALAPDDGIGKASKMLADWEPDERRAVARRTNVPRTA